MLGVPLLGCHSHRFNLAVEAYLQQYLSSESELISKLMSKLATLKQSGRLCLMTSLRPVKQNLTWWTGAPGMFACFERLLPTINQEDKELSELIPSAAQKRNFWDHKQALENFKSVTIELQRHNISYVETDLLFKSIIDSNEHFDFEHYLGKHADMIHNKHLEAAIIKIQSSKEDTLTGQELPAVKDLLLPAQHIDQPGEDKDNGLLFAGRVLRCQRLQSEKASGVYINTNFLLPTSNDVERLFSMAKQVFCPSCRSLQPRTLEALQFLKKNQLLWNPSLVALVVNENAFESEDNEHGDEDEWWSTLKQYISMQYNTI